MVKRLIRNRYFFDWPEEPRFEQPWFSPHWTLPPATLDHALMEFHEYGKEGKLTRGMMRRLLKREWLVVEGPGPDGRMFAIHLQGDFGERVVNMFEVEPPRDNYTGEKN